MEDMKANPFDREKLSKEVLNEWQSSSMTRLISLMFQKKYREESVKQSAVSGW